ncbi:MAG TPA: thymidylate kinase [Patescibacteria group bacterium]|nr:thymidylate kinase [Patescibacteria group bacterium]
MPKGKFMVIDGMDGSGKTEQTKLLVERLRKEGLPVETISFPRYDTDSGKVVKAYLDGAFGTPDEVGPKRASILYAVDRYAASREMRQSLDAGTNLVANRYVASNMGHQGSKERREADRMAFYRWNDELEFGLFDIPRPDLNVILHVPVDISLALIEKRGATKDMHENRAHLEVAEATYLEIARTFPGFALIECVEGGRLLSIPEVHEKVWAAVAPLLA